MFKKFLCLITAAILAVTAAACGGGADKNASSGTWYEEKELGSNKSVLSPGLSRIDSKGRLVVFDYGDGNASKYVILDGEGKTVGEIPTAFIGGDFVFNLDSADNIYTVVKNLDSAGNMVQKLVVTDPSGKMTNTWDLDTISISNNKSPGRGICDIFVDSSNSIYLADPQTGIRVLDKNGKELKTIDLPGVSGICNASDGRLAAFVLNPSDISLNIIDTSTGKVETKQAINVKGGINTGNFKIFYNNADKCVYQPFSNEILKFDPAKKSIATAMSFSDYTILASGLEYSDMSMDSSGNFYVIANDMSGIRAGTKSVQAGGPKPAAVYSIFKYTLMKGVKKDDAKILTLVTRRDDRFLDLAASKFQKENPGYKIKIEAQQGGQVQQAGQNKQNQQNYINDLNTRILSGKGPDIFMSGFLPYEKYASRNLLADLAGFMASDKSFKPGDYYSNILDAYKKNGKMFVLPVSFAFSGLIANKRILDEEGISIDDGKWTWDDFKAIAEKLGKKDSGGSTVRTALPNISCSDMLDSLMMVNGSKFVDRSKKTSSFDSPEFVSILNVIKAFGDPKLASTGMKQGMPDILDAAGRGSIVFYPTSIQDYMNYSLMKTAFKESIDLLKLPSDGSTGDDTFTSNQIYSISSASKYKDKAWEFLKILLSEEVQTQMDIGGFSVNKAAQQKKAEQMIDMTAKGNVKIMMGPNGKALTPMPLTQADIDFVNSYIPGLKRYSGTDDRILQIVKDETAAFFSGDKTAEETVRLIQEKVRLYLGE